MQRSNSSLLGRSATPGSDGSTLRRIGSWGGRLLEFALVSLAIALVLPAFGPLAADDAGRDRRFASDAESVRGLPRPVVPTLCAAYGTLAEDAVRARICRHDGADAAADRIDGVPAVARRAHAQAVDAFFAPLRHAKASVDELQRQQREGEGDVQALGLAIESARARVAPYAERYGLDPVAGRGPRSLECAFERLHAGMPRTGDASPALHEITRANAVLLFGAALDGLPATAAVATAAALPATAAVSPACAETSLVESLAVAATVMAEARATPAGIAKDAAMRGLLRNAGWQWAGWGLTGLVLLNLARSGLSPAAGVAVALSTWAVAAFVGRVPAPFMHDGEIVFGRAAEPMLSEPAGFVVALLACALAILPFVRFRGSATQSVRAAAGSPLAYPGLVLATGVGFVVLLDLSAHAHFANRYLALYHHGHLWLGMLVFSTVAFLRRPLGRALAWTLSVADAAAGRLVRAFGPVAAGAALLALAMAAAGLAAALLGNMRQLTSEIGRLWLIVGAAWFFFMRGTPLAERVARGGSTIGSLVRYVAPLAFVAAVLLAAMVATRDMGPLLIAGYGAGAFVAASVAMWWHQRRNAGAAAYAIAAALFVGWIVVTTSALLRFGELDPVTSGRIENAAAPLASANDQLALVTWFQRAAPADGFGPGGVPWCGHASTARCAGVPAQVQSDYTFTALVGVFGPSAAWAFTLACVGWLHAVVRAHARATRGEPRIVRRARGFGIDEQAFVSWLCVAWVVLAMCQLAVTVAGNLAVIPLTGVTFPFVSFGMTSLVVNMAMLGLAANVDASHGNA